MARSPSLAPARSRASLNTVPPDARHSGRAAWETLRLVSAHSASNSARSGRAWRRTAGSDQAPVRWARATVAEQLDGLEQVAHEGGTPFEADSVTMVTRQPSFSSPTRLATGIRTSSRKSSANSVEPAMVRAAGSRHRGVHGQDQPA